MSQKWTMLQKAIRKGNNGMTNVRRHLTEGSQREVSAANVATTHRSPGPDAWPAKSKQCNLCEKYGHFRKMCHKSAKPSVQEVKETVANDETYFCGSINCDDSSPAWKVDLDLNEGQRSSSDLQTGLRSRCVSDVWQQLQTTEAQAQSQNSQSELEQSGRSAKLPWSVHCESDSEGNCVSLPCHRCREWRGESPKSGGCFAYESHD